MSRRTASDCFTGARIHFGPASYGPSYRIVDTRPNLIDELEESWAERDDARRAKASRHYQREARKAKFRKLVVEHVPAVGLGLFAGMMLTVGLAYVIGLAL